MFDSFLSGEIMIWSFLVLSIVAGRVIAVLLRILHRKARVNRYLEDALSGRTRRTL